MVFLITPPSKRDFLFFFNCFYIVSNKGKFCWFRVLVLNSLGAVRTINRLRNQTNSSLNSKSTNLYNNNNNSKPSAGTLKQF